MTDLERAIEAIAEVRQRIASAQRFKGYSAIAAAASAVFAFVTGIVQALIDPSPVTPHEGRLFFALWFICSAASIVVNYGAIAHWFAGDVSARERWQTRTVGLSILPAIVFGGILSFALLHGDALRFVPAVWCGAYGVGLFASRMMVPGGVVYVAAGFVLAGMALAFAPPEVALAWWPMTVAFGLGQSCIAALIVRERGGSWQ
ncbi:MAG: hypothetical protein JO160_00020 [Candidatus Eremiobacteraeota bacterium]|nr:hypothetical protein [Candidatus Eremiobacteraeota bacterium]